MNVSRRELLAALAIFIAAMAVVYLVGPRDFMTGDTTHYVAMVRGDSAPAPFAYRVLTPTLVSWLPLSTGHGFFVVTYTATLGTLLTMFLLFRHLGVSQAAAIVAGVFLCLSYPLANYLARWGRIDPLANLLFALALLLILRRNFLPAALVMAFGVLGKETLIFLVPILLLHRLTADRRTPRAYLAAAALCSLPLASLITVRSMVEPEEGSFTVESREDVNAVLERVWAYNIDAFGLPQRIARDLTKSYGFLWALAGLGLLTVRRLRIESLYLIAIGFLLCVVATDWARMLGTGFPGIFIPVAFFVDRLRDTPHWRPLMAGFLTLTTLQCYLSLLIFRDLDRPHQLAMMIGQILVVLTGMGLALWGSFHRDPWIEKR